jgi:glucose dehydrogenase
MPRHKETARPSLKWKTKLPGVQNAVLPSQTTRPNPLVAGEKVFASLFAPGAVCAVARGTGKLLWKNSLDSYASSAVFLQKRVLYATSNRTLYALNPDTGSIHWEYSPQSATGEWIYSQPAVRAGRVFIGDRSGYFHCLDQKTGNLLWRRQSSRGCNNQVNSTALVVGERVISANNEGVVVCYSVATGKTLWRQRIDGACVGELLQFQSKVVLAAKSLYAIDLQTGAVRTELNFPEKTVVSVSVAASRIALILGTDFQSQPSAWNQPSAFNGELVILEGSHEVVRRTLKGTPHVRTCTESGLLCTVDHSIMSVIDPSDGLELMSRRGELALPSFSDGELYGLTREGALFSEQTSLAR